MTESYEEYRVAWRFPGSSEDTYSKVTKDKGEAERAAERVKSNSRVQVRTVTLTEWGEADSGD